VRTDKLSQEQRSRLMRAVRPTETSLEKKLRKALWDRGHRYRKNYKKARGTPDIAFVRLKIAVFCDSEFWHGHDWENRKKDFKSNQKFWHSKIERNMERDREVDSALKEEGWIVLRFWGREIKKESEKCVDKIEQAIKESQNILEHSN
jgi:DNA mismatch endonuclease Vsr